jgi:Flp pilus assembly protein TadB
MSRTQAERTTRTAHTTAVQSPRDRAGTRTTRGFAAFVAAMVAVSAAVVAVATAPFVAAAAGVGVAATATTVVAARRTPDRRTRDPPDDEVAPRQRAGPTAD